MRRKINKLLSRINKIKQQEIELKKEQALLNEQIDQTTIMERRAQRVMEQAAQLFERFMEAARAYGEYIVLHQQIEQLQASIRDNEQEIEETGRLLQEKRARLQDMRYSLERIKQEANRLRIYEKSYRHPERKRNCADVLKRCRKNCRHRRSIFLKSSLRERSED